MLAKLLTKFNGREGVLHVYENTKLTAEIKGALTTRTTHVSHFFHIKNESFGIAKEHIDYFEFTQYNKHQIAEITIVSVDGDLYVLSIKGEIK